MTSLHHTRTTETDTNRGTESTRVCSECGGDIIKESGEHVCESCGLVIAETHIDRGPEWRAFDSKERDEKSRVGAPTTHLKHDKGLSTDIGSTLHDGYGNTLSQNKRKKIHRLKKWNKRFKTKTSKERNLQGALNEIQRMGSALGLSEQVQETASVLYKQCLDNDMLPGRSIEAMSSACLYAASRICESPRTLDEIRPVTSITPTTKENDANEIQRAYRYISKELDVGIMPPDPRQYLNRILNDLDIENKQELHNTSLNVIETAEEANIHSGRAPIAIAASAIYIANGIHNTKISQKEIAEIADLSVVTIRDRYQEIIKEHCDVESPQHIFNYSQPRNE